MILKDSMYIAMRYLRGYISFLFCFLFMAVFLETGALASVLRDPGISDGEQIVWRVTKKDREPTFSMVIWHVKDRDGRPVYEVTTDSGELKQAKYIIDKSDLRLISAHVRRKNHRGRSEVNIEVKGDQQYLTYEFNDKDGEKEIEHGEKSYNGMTLIFSLRGFPFGKREKIKLRATPPFKPWYPRWTWKMWKSYAKVKEVEKVTVPAGTFECYKLEVAPSSRFVRQFTNKYHFWFTKEPPHWFVKYQDKDGDSVTELMEIKSVGKK
jgi:hypothetical protein